jgi:hypothetical protein
MRQVFGGAFLVIAGIAAFIEAHEHRPLKVLAPPEGPGDPTARAGSQGSTSSRAGPDRGPAPLWPI